MPAAPIRTHPFDLMRAGYEILLDVVAAHGFEAHEPHWELPDDEAEPALDAYGRGQNRALGEIARGDRVIELVLHRRLRPPTYRLGGVRIGHAALMRGGGAGELAFPAATADALEDFRAVASDLRRWGGAFVGM